MINVRESTNFHYLDFEPSLTSLLLPFYCFAGVAHLYLQISDLYLLIHEKLKYEGDYQDDASCQ